MAGLVVLTLGTREGIAQDPREITLSRPTASFPEPFSFIAGLRELPGGRVLVSDGIENVLLRVDLSRGTADTVGRSGRGPGEYMSPDGIFPYSGGGTLLMDLGNGRLSHYAADGSYRESWSIARGEPGRGMTMVVPQGTDGTGRIYFESRGGAIQGNAPPDSGKVLRWDPVRDAIDTVATVKLPETKVSTSGSANNRSVSMRQTPLSSRDAWAVAPDGRVALVSVTDYHVEWHEANGRRVVGKPVPFRPVPVRQADKEEYQADAATSGLSMSVEDRNGQVSASFRRGGPPGGRAPDGRSALGDLEWPSVKPPFNPAGVRVSSDGDLWVERYVPAGAPRQYDVFGSDANLKLRVTLPAGRRLVALGQGVVYTRHLDNDDLQYLERYAVGER